MPTIEIPIYESENLQIDTSKFKLAILISNELVGHRGLFIDEFESQKGTMLHLGNPEFKDDDGMFWGSKLIDWKSKKNSVQTSEINETDNPVVNQQYVFQLNPKFRYEIDRLLKIGIANSKINKISFLTDYQLGPEKESKRAVYSISDFWEIHDNEKLVFNTMYDIYQE